jgi:hypothetical protein
MIRTSLDLPGWTFEGDELSTGVFRVVGRDRYGHTVERNGIDPDELIRECIHDAKHIEKQIKPHRM